MRLALAASALPDTPLPEVLAWAGQAGFDAVELAAPPVRGATTWHTGSRLVPAAMDGVARDALGAALEEAHLELAALDAGVALVDADEPRAAAAAKHLLAVIETAVDLGVPVVTVALGRLPGAPAGDAAAAFARAVSRALAMAEEGEVALAVETDPRLGAGDADEDEPASVCFAPELWEKLFTHARSPALGLALDPGPMAWLGLDPVAAVTDYAEKVVHVRARDCEVFEMRRRDCSILRPGGGWWRYRLPGLGRTDWRRLFDRLWELDYRGAVAVVCDDPVWRGTDEKTRAGLALARRHLAQFMA